MIGGEAKRDVDFLSRRGPIPRIRAVNAPEHCMSIYKVRIEFQREILILFSLKGHIPRYVSNLPPYWYSAATAAAASLNDGSRSSALLKSLTACSQPCG